MSGWARDRMAHHGPPGGSSDAAMNTDLHGYGAAVTRAHVEATRAALTARAAHLEPGTDPATIAAYLDGLLELPDPSYTSDKDQP